MEIEKKMRKKLDGVGAQTPYYTRKEFMNYHLPREWEIARDAEINPFKDVLVFRQMVEFLRILPINLKGNMWESNDLIENPINWVKPSKRGDGAWHAKIRIIDPDAEEFTKTFQSILTSKKLSKKRIQERSLYLMRRSLEVLRKFHMTTLRGRFNQLSHVLSPLLSKPWEY
nr:hypothetical protein [Tanacetum cinerariifolium]